ncbi:SAM-dependent methyltransferase [Actinomadura opuntiae]|uniref:SAM-dependent methyltransferase n=1 Tax=Actinomadura sp. OS1-43 TaxID=604315 RepID=UPI00255B18EE|nr:SAM-dependent methyltransferase [Actinomadura sp. OS1-43]MDL4817462.1 SAM-dependent methyltransferase [Actinomadura sp. OS1-43]
MNEPDWAGGIDPNQASVARVYDYLLGGAHSFTADRDIARTLEAIEPTLRTAEEIGAFFTGFDLLDPGLVHGPLWRPDSPEDVPDDPSQFWFLVGAGRKP